MSDYIEEEGGGGKVEWYVWYSNHPQDGSQDSQLNGGESLNDEPEHQVNSRGFYYYLEFISF